MTPFRSPRWKRLMFQVSDLGISCVCSNDDASARDDARSAYVPRTPRAYACGHRHSMGTLLFFAICRSHFLVKQNVCIFHRDYCNEPLREFIMCPFSTRQAHCACGADRAPAVRVRPSVVVGGASKCVFDRAARVFPVLGPLRLT